MHEWAVNSITHEWAVRNHLAQVPLVSLPYIFPPLSSCRIIFCSHDTILGYLMKSFHQKGDKEKQQKPQCPPQKKLFNKGYGDSLFMLFYKRQWANTGASRMVNTYFFTPEGSGIIPSPVTVKSYFFH